MKMQGPLLKIIKNVKMMTAEHDTKCWVFLSVGSLRLHRWHAHEARLGVRKDFLKKH